MGKEKPMESISFEDIKQIMREAAEMRKETERMFQETDRKFQDTERLVKELSQRISGVNDNIGFAAETYFQNALSKTLTFGGIRFDEAFLNLKKQRRGASCEFDLVMVNHEAVALIEVKHRLYPALPEEMVTKKAVQFRTFFPEYQNYALYLGIAGLSMNDKVVEEARKFGVGVVRQDGDSIESFDVPLKSY
jgi:hypothetical protein